MGIDEVVAANEDVGDAPELVDFGRGIDTAVVLANDIVRGNCENVLPLPPVATTVAQASSGTTDDEEHQQQREASLSGRGG
jgi:hypothetical protein